MQGLIPQAHEAFAHRVFAGLRQTTAVTTEDDVAPVAWQAANDILDRLHSPAGADALALATQR